MRAFVLIIALVASGPASFVDSHAHGKEHAKPDASVAEVWRTETCYLRGCESIVVSLLEFIDQAYRTYGGDNYPPISDIPMPEVHFISRTELVNKACPKEYCDAIGWFPNEGNIVYIATDQDVVNDLHARGILLHELVHYVQHRIGLPTGENPCLTWKAREMQAYGIQYHWLRVKRARVKTLAHNFRLAGYSRMTCDTESRT